jgi:hypothetical protein
LGKFTVSLGVFFPKLEELRYNPTIKYPSVVQGIPAMGYCDFDMRTRLGILATGKDEWFEVRNLPPPPRVVPNTDVEQLARRLTDAWQAFGRPWFEEHGELDNWFKSEKTPSPPLLLLMGEKAKARRVIIEGLLNRVGDPESRLAWARYRGLVDDFEAARIAEVWHWPTEEFERAIKEVLLRDKGN